MLPPIEDVVLRNNPNFSALYANLTKNVLMSKGISKTSHDKEYEATKQELRKERIHAAKKQLIRTAVRDLDISPPNSTSSKPPRSTTVTEKTLPPELVELILLLSSHLNSPPFDSESQAALESTEKWHSLQSNLPNISTLIASHLHTRVLQLSRILSPTTNPSYLHRTIPKLCPSISSLQAHIEQQKEALAARRNAMVTQTLQILELYQQAIELTVSHLEQTTHGILSRNIRAKSDYLSVQAQTVSLLVKEKEITARKMVYTKQVQRALANYMQHLRIERERVGERQREAKRILWGYGVGRDDGGEKERVMKEVARMYGLMKEEIQSVERDVNRLKGK